ncbi:TauD/TfdA family dioxygenase [Acidocella sp.]|uniref:TauD/TfdA dioxygenase family protein n=1 Tax=Acidocella sp. TaxID=50710 RepID=UPI00262A2835|nr:TauD/TfdA family dioxygenase [Acidocella sp.]
MTAINVRDLSSDLSFGAIVDGVNYERLGDPAVRSQLNQIFEDRGLIVFENVEPSQKMHLAVSDVFGPLKEHPSNSTPRVEGATLPGVIDMHSMPREVGEDKSGLVEINGKILARFSPWHFDHCYNDELNRAGVLRAVINAPKGEGGRTGFADGIQLYKDFDPELRSKMEYARAIYTLDVRLTQQRFGRTFKTFGDTPPELKVAEESRTFPRALHPMIWTRKDGKKVLHVGPWMSVGMEHHEDAEGEVLFEAICQEVNRKADAKSYWHDWKPTDLLIWDNWRLLHAVEGCDPKWERQTQRTTIKGDYGLGAFEGGKKVGEVLRALAM